jgi:formamidopyrimidine-DNA glycosylase
MFELPELINLARDVNETLSGKVVKQGSLGNVTHKFVWYNRSPEEFDRLTQGKKVGEARAVGRWLFIGLEPGYVLLFGECGGRMLYHPVGAKLPDKYHLWLTFEDDSFFTVTTQMWGAMELYEVGKEQEREYIKGMRPTPVDPAFTFEYFSQLIDSLLEGEKRSVKGLLTQEQLIPGLGNAIAQDILFKARLNPRFSISDLDRERRRRLYDAIISVVSDVAAKGGRYDEYDLYNHRGQYVRLMDSKAVGKPCPECGSQIEKIQYLGGACYYCPHCQK